MQKQNQIRHRCCGSSLDCQNHFVLAVDVIVSCCFLFSMMMMNNSDHVQVKTFLNYYIFHRISKQSAIRKCSFKVLLRTIGDFVAVKGQGRERRQSVRDVLQANVSDLAAMKFEIFQRSQSGGDMLDACIRDFKAPVQIHRGKRRDVTEMLHADIGDLEISGEIEGGEHSASRGDNFEIRIRNVSADKTERPQLRPFLSGLVTEEARQQGR